MSKKYTSFSILVFVFLCFGCKTEVHEFDYNQKANEVIKQVILDQSCGCILEIPSESLSKILENENPKANIKEEIIEKLELKSYSQLDSLENISNNFALDSISLARQNVFIIKRSMVIDSTLLKKCPNGILSILKPVFAPTYKKAYINYKLAFTCVYNPGVIYKFKNNKWVK